MAETNPQAEQLDKMLRRPGFGFLWLALNGLVLFFLSWPLRNIALVCWVYGSRGYFHDGIRVLYGKPVRFSTGMLAPTLPDIVTGFGAFIITVSCVSALMIFVLRFYQRHFSRRDDHAA